MILKIISSLVLEIINCILVQVRIDKCEINLDSRTFLGKMNTGLETKENVKNI